MESAALTRRGPGSGIAARARSVEVDTLAKVAFAVLCVGFLVGFLIFPTYPNYDSYYSMLWGREVLDLQAPFFQGFRVPTEHPLAIAAGALVSLLGEGGDRVWVAMTLGCFLWLVWGIYRLGQIAFTPLVGAIAAALLLTRFDFAFLAARGYIDVPYMALVVWAAVLEARTPRRGRPVFALLGAAGLLRPEAWILAGLYFLWMSRGATWGERARYAAMAAVAPAVWAAVDGAVTGDPLFSLHYTSGSAEDLGRQRTVSQIPTAIPEFFTELVKTPVLAAAAIGLVLGTAMSPPRLVMPVLLLVTGLATFVVIGIAGASIIERYLAVAALALMVLAAIAVGGWTMLVPGRLRTTWMALAAIVVLTATGWTAFHLNLGRFKNELRFRGQAHHDLTQVLADPRVKAGLRCGPLTGPNHKIVPDSRWIGNLTADKVLPRAQFYRNGKRLPKKGVAIVVTSRFAIFKHAWTDPNDDPRIQLPPAGFDRAKITRFYAAYVRC